jgi:methyl-accepting chemotaxis protein
MRSSDFTPVTPQPLASSSPASRTWRPLVSWTGVGPKIFGSFLVVMLIAAAVGAFAAVRLNSTVAAFEEAAANSEVLLDASQDAIAALRVATRAVRDYVQGEEAQMEPLHSQRRRELQGALHRLEPALYRPESRRALAEVWTLEATFGDTASQIDRLLATGQQAAGLALFTERMDPTRLRMNELLESISDREATSHKDRRLAISTDAANTSRVFLLASGLGLVLSLILAGLITRWLTSHLHTFVSMAQRVREGDLSASVHVRSRDEIGELGGSLNTMVDALREIAAQIRETSAGLGSESQRLLSASSELAAGAAQQSAAIVQTSTTIEEVKASADQAVQRALVVADAADRVRSVAAEGVQAARRAMDGMTDVHARVDSVADTITALSEQAQQIGDIIGAVTELADQSNLLALNAAIEASRAGEHGKGFAVVAAEIRNLSEQSKAATTQIRAILSEIQRATSAAVMAMESGSRGVDDGIRLVDEAARTIEELSDVVEPAAQEAQQISASVREHAIGMEQIASAMGQIRQATYQSVQAAEATKKAAEALDGSSRRMSQLVARYEV